MHHIALSPRQCLYDATVKQGDNRLADYWKKNVDETLDMLERRAKLIGI